MSDKSINEILASLSPTETRVLTALFTGASNKVIAKQLGIADGTVKVHMKSLFHKAGVCNRTQAVIKLIPLGSTLCGMTALLTREQYRAEMAMEAEFSGPLVLATWGDAARPAVHAIGDRAA